MRRSTGIACLFIFVGLAATAHAARDGQAPAPTQSMAATAAAVSDDPQSCSPCHGDIVQQLKAHPHTPSDKKVSCSDCHTVEAAHLRSPRAASASAHSTPSVPERNAACTRCHTNDAGPFAHEHPAVNVEGCASCHAAHGSANPKMLTVGSESVLCLQCHAETTTKSPHAAASPPVAKPVDCTTCHRQIHGSNTSEVFLQ
jgi:DmsE family decaheme c-type cytochrome